MTLQDITIYHKSGDLWVRYAIQASLRNTSILNRDRTGVTNTDRALLRAFDVDGYGSTWYCSKGDIVVNRAVTDDIVSAPLTELNAKYGKDNVFQVQSIDEFIFGMELDHVKIGAK